ncbi:hypothetical protein PAXRUDRAFT_825786, partial [Paxillus rubicundulus Ve08.2h10]
MSLATHTQIELRTLHRLEHAATFANADSAVCHLGMIMQMLGIDQTYALNAKRWRSGAKRQSITHEPLDSGLTLAGKGCIKRCADIKISDWAWTARGRPLMRPWCTGNGALTASASRKVTARIVTTLTEMMERG